MGPSGGGNRYGSTYRDVVFRELIPGNFGCGIDRGALFAHHKYLNVLSESLMFQKIFGFTTCGSVCLRRWLLSDKLPPFFVFWIQPLRFCAPEHADRCSHCGADCLVRPGILPYKHCTEARINAHYPFLSQRRRASNSWRRFWSNTRIASSSAAPCFVRQTSFDGRLQQPFVGHLVRPLPHVSPQALLLRTKRVPDALHIPRHQDLMLTFSRPSASARRMASNCARLHFSSVVY